MEKLEPSIEKIYSDPEKCRQDIILARKMFGDSRSTPAHFDECERSLGFMLLYAPEDIVPLVQATLSELGTRRTFRMFGEPGFMRKMLEEGKQP